MRKLHTTAVVVALACLIWFDACLYFQIQSMDNNELSSIYTLPSTTAKHNRPPNNSSFSQLQKLQPFLNLFSFAFHGLSVKLMMTDPVDNYLMGPLSEVFAQWCDFRNNFHFISANMVSYAGVVSALIAAKLVTHDNPLMHKLSVLFFQLRTWLDDLDGEVARSRLGIVKHVSLQKTSGYVVDGVCDAIGFVAYIIGCYLYLKNTINRGQTSLRSSSSSSSLQPKHRRSIERFNLKPINNNESSQSAYVPVKQQEEEEYSDAENSSNLSESYEEDEEVEILCNNSSCQITPEDEDQLSNNNNKKWKDHKQHFINLASTMRMPREYWSKTSRILMDHIQPASGRNGKQSDLVFYRYIKEKIQKNFITNRRLLKLIACFLLQLALCSAFWNRYILVYRDLLESHSTSSTQARVKIQILKSNIMFIIIWFWRLTNGHTFMQMLAGSIFFGKLWQFLEFIKYLGFVEILTLAAVTELHVMDVRNYLSNWTD